MNQGVENWNRQDRSIALGNLSQDGASRFFELGERDDVKPLDFVGVGSKLLAGLGPDDDRRHQKAGASGKVVELPQHIGRLQFEPDLFVGLSKGGLDDRFFGVEATAGEGELSCVVAKLGRSSRDEEAGFAVFVGRDDEGDSGRAQVGARHSLAFESSQVVADAGPKMDVEVMSFDSHDRGA